MYHGYDGLMMANSHPVDELLKITDPAEEREEVTGVYNVKFFEAHVKQPTPLERLADARIGLSLFLEEASRALESPTNELTPDQRIHVATITSFIEGLSARFDRIRVPGYMQKVSKLPR